jgi:hypothetical protein
MFSHQNALQLCGNDSNTYIFENDYEHELPLQLNHQSWYLGVTKNKSDEKDSTNGKPVIKGFYTVESFVSWPFRAVRN